MKKLFFLLSFFVLIPVINAQIYNPVSWSTSVKKISETDYNLLIEATIETNWHIYAQKVPEDGPIPTHFTFKASPHFELIGETLEPEGHTDYDPVFRMELTSFEGKATFTQRIKRLSKEAFAIEGELEFIACDDRNCLPPTFVDLHFPIPGGQAAVHTPVAAPPPSLVPDKAPVPANKNLFRIFIIAFLSGFAALLTPCVFPMIPMTVSFFTKQSQSKAAGIRNALVYGISIVVIYVALGVLISLLFGPNALNALSTNVWFNVFFFLVLIVFALSFLGAFELTLPSSWGTRVDAQADKGGFLGIFFMALALAIVSFSCTGPIVGTILVEAATGGNQVGPIVGMFGFSLAIALPFALFAAFPGWLNSLPKSGGWLNTVKVVLGFLELALAFKFLSNADLVLQLHLLEREVFLALWIAVFATLSLYLFGSIRLPHDSPSGHISVGRLSLGMLSLAFTFYMIPGLWGAPLNLISAFPPAQHYSESPYGVGATNPISATESAKPELPEGAHLMPPHDLLAFNDYDLGLAYAKKVGKPVLIDFTGHACVNCRKMEQRVWAVPRVMNLLKNDLVLISLYVDDKRPLPKGMETDSKLRPGKTLRYIGQKWSEFQTLRYQANAQPFYVLMDLNEENLVTPVAYTPDVDTYYNWLQSGLANFKQ